MSSSVLPSTATVELARVDADDARYILCADGHIVVGGSRAAIMAEYSDLVTHLTYDIFAVADEKGGNTRRTAWGIGRHVAQSGNDSDGFGAGVVTGENFARLVDDIESAESLRQNHGQIDAASSGYTALATFYAVRTILDEVIDLFGEPYDMMTFNDVSPQFIYDGMKRLGVLDIEASISALTAVAPVGVVSWGFQAVMVDVGLAALVKRYSKDGNDASDGSTRGIDFYFDASRPREFIWWVAASAFLLADVRLGDTFSDRAVAVAAGRAVVEEFVTFDPWDIVRMFTTAGSDGERTDDIRMFLRRCVAGGYPLAEVSRLLRRESSIAELLAMMDAGIDWEMASAAVD